MNPLIEHMRTFFDPKAVAVIGASRRTMKAGHVIFKNFVINKQRGLFKASLYPVNPSGGEILGRRVYTGIDEIDGPVQAVSIAIPFAMQRSVVTNQGKNSKYDIRNKS